MEERQQRILDNGVITSTIWQFDDIRMGHAVSSFKDLSGFSASNANDVVRLHFGLKGDYRFHYKQLNKSFDLIGGHHNIMWSDGFEMTVKNKTLNLETFGVQFPKKLFVEFTHNANDLLKRFADEILSGKSALLSDPWGALDVSIEQVIQQVLHCRYTGDLKKLFLLSKSIELLVLSAESCNRSAMRKDTFIKNPSDKEKIIAARDLINDRLTSPPNLSDIAKTIGLNEYKLKRGFKETFNTTVFGYLTEQRLQLAHQYLLATHKTAAEVSAELGYATPQHFNNAFKKKFGVTPYLVKKNP